MTAGAAITICAKNAPSPDSGKADAMAGIAGATAIGISATKDGPETTTIDFPSVLACTEVMNSPYLTWKLVSKI
jgi:hypothetical protein